MRKHGTIGIRLGPAQTYLRPYDPDYPGYYCHTVNHIGQRTLSGVHPGLYDLT